MKFIRNNHNSIRLHCAFSRKRLLDTGYWCGLRETTDVCPDNSSEVKHTLREREFFQRCIWHFHEVFSFANTWRAMGVAGRSGCFEFHLWSDREARDDVGWLQNAKNNIRSGVVWTDDDVRGAGEFTRKWWDEFSALMIRRGKLRLENLVATLTDLWNEPTPFANVVGVMGSLDFRLRERSKWIIGRENIKRWKSFFANSLSEPLCSKGHPSFVWWQDCHQNRDQNQKQS